LAELKKPTGPRQWSLEGRQLAIVKVHLQGRLKRGQDEDHATPLPDGYSNTAKTIAERQAALAGYRLADEIIRCLPVN
jgi:hypothetical protein